jgi:hypothetical protein
MEIILLFETDKLKCAGRVSWMAGTEVHTEWRNLKERDSPFFVFR